MMVSSNLGEPISDKPISVSWWKFDGFPTLCWLNHIMIPYNVGKTHLGMVYT